MTDAVESDRRHETPSLGDGSEQVTVPVKCPRCGKISQCEFPAIVVVAALTKWNNMNLYVACHPDPWDASKEDLARIREHVGKGWLSARIPAPRAPW